MREMKVRTHRERGHRRGCDARRLAKSGEWATAWSLPDHDSTVWKRGSRPWLRLRCNDVQCHAILQVDYNTLLETLEPKW